MFGCLCFTVDHNVLYKTGKMIILTIQKITKNNNYKKKYANNWYYKYRISNIELS